MKNAIILCLLAAVIVSAQQKQRVAVLPSVGDLDPQRLILLTDKVREIATKNLPRDNFNILKQDVITKMIGEEELYRACKEGVCIGDLARKTNANYGARCDVVKLDDNRLVLKFELYSVNEDAIFETFIDYNVKDFYGMLASLEARLPDVFKKIVGASEKAAARDKAREPQRRETKTQQEYTPMPKPASGSTFTDSRDGKTYKKVTIGKQTWMAENLNYAVGGSKCYTNKSSNCEQYGRLYNWSTAKSVCPAGWHLPKQSEWTTLVEHAGGEKTAGKKLKATAGWKGWRGNGTDEYGFSALPGGYGGSDGSFDDTGLNGNWWSATEYDTYYAWYRILNNYDENVSRDNNYKTRLYSVRCVAD